MYLWFVVSLHHLAVISHSLGWSYCWLHMVRSLLTSRVRLSTTDDAADGYGSVASMVCLESSPLLNKEPGCLCCDLYICINILSWDFHRIPFNLVDLDEWCCQCSCHSSNIFSFVFWLLFSLLRPHPSFTQNITVELLGVYDVVTLR